MKYLLVRDGGIDHGNLHQVLLGILHALGDGGGNFVSLTETVTYDTVLVSHHHDGGEAEVTATLGDLGHTVDGYQSVLEFKVRGLYSFYV